MNLDWDAAMLEELSAAGADLSALWAPRELEQLLGHGLHPGQTADDAGRR